MIHSRSITRAPLHLGHTLQHSTAGYRALTRGARLDQLAGGTSNRITGGTSRTRFGQPKHVLKAVEQHGRFRASRTAPMVRRLAVRSAPRIMGPAPEDLAAFVTHNVPRTRRGRERRGLPRHRVTARAVHEEREAAG